MTKVMFLNCWTNPADWFDKYIFPCYSTLYTHLNIIPTKDPKEADFFVIGNYLADPNIDLKKAIVYHYEPKSTRDNWSGAWHDKSNFKALFDIPSNHVPVHPYLRPHKNYFEGIPALTEDRLDNLCVITSALNTLPGHKLRLNFVQHLVGNRSPIHLYGLNVGGCRGRVCERKSQTLCNYKYTFMAENTQEPGYFTEKLWDALISENLIFYWGCTNLNTFIPEESYISIPLDDPDESCKMIYTAIYSGQWAKRLSAIREAKRLMLEKYSLFSVVDRLVS